ncbi:hypothetical protein PQX77_010115 [Marasmius sp. AFHP31]|nr:hypothetical protein PQX77_010115 [Marasmius sp. AFHP31]
MNELLGIAEDNEALSNEALYMNKKKPAGRKNTRAREAYPFFHNHDVLETLMMMEDIESSLVTTNELKPPCFLSSIPQAVNNHEDWPSKLSEWTDPLLELKGASSLDKDDSLIDTIASTYPDVLNTVNRTFQRAQRVLTTDTRFPELGPDTKTTIIGPVAAEILQEMIADLELHYEVAYAKGVCPCQQNTAGIPYFSSSGFATVVICAPILLDDSTLQSIQVPPVESSESSGSLSGSFAEREGISTSDKDQVDNASMNSSDSEDATMEDMSSSGRFTPSRPPYNPDIYEAVLRHLRAAHAPLLDGMDNSCGLFDLSAYSSIVSLAAYLSRIIPILSVSICKARENKCSFPEGLAVWRLDALPPQREEHEEDRTEAWVTRIQNE